MVTSVKKNRTRKSKLRINVSDSEIADERISLRETLRAAKTLNNLIKRIYSQNSSTRPGNKFHKNSQNDPYHQIMIQDLFNSKRNFVVRPNDNKSSLSAKNFPRPPPINIKSHPRPPQHIVTPQPFQAPNQPSIFNHDPNYRNKFKLSSLFKQVNDILPSPAMFSFHSNYINEAPKYLQELSLEKMSIFYRDEPNPSPNYSSTTVDDFSKYCERCKTDFSPAFTPLDSKNTIFLCEKCFNLEVREKRSKLDILSAYLESQPENILPKTNPLLQKLNPPPVIPVSSPQVPRFQTPRPILKHNHTVPQSKPTVHSVEKLEPLRLIHKSDPFPLTPLSQQTISGIPQLIVHSGPPRIIHHSISPISPSVPHSLITRNMDFSRVNQRLPVFTNIPGIDPTGGLGATITIGYHAPPSIIAVSTNPSNPILFDNFHQNENIRRNVVFSSRPGIRFLKIPTENMTPRMNYPPRPYNPSQH